MACWAHAYLGTRLRCCAKVETTAASSIRHICYSINATLAIGSVAHLFGLLSLVVAHESHAEWHLFLWIIKHSDVLEGDYIVVVAVHTSNG